jgi:uncharacterized 2Fe-2S/4Fe-4S cluster protein (DUF4445 family)
MPEVFCIDFEPLGRRSEGRPDQTILNIAQKAGVGLASVCGGVGTCAECRIRLVSGELTPHTLVEQFSLSNEDLVAGYRLACQAKPLSDVKLDIPPESLSTNQRLQVEGLETIITVNPAVRTPGAFGLAVDIGTTKIATYLVRLETGETVAKSGAMNPQIAFGEDVISRIAYITNEKGGETTLQKLLVDTLNKMLEGMCNEVGISPTNIQDAVLVGNTIMHHIFVGLPVEQLGRAPFKPATIQPLTIPARKTGLNINPNSNAYLPPVIAGYVGSDHIAMLLATDKWKSTGNVISMDIGTNTEISLVKNGRITCCSCASGPAFEGAHIKEGMRAGPGAIERALWVEGKILWQSIDALPPVGICGSGILDSIAALQDGDLIKPSGVLKTGSEIVLVPSEKNGLGRDLVLTRKDIHEIQLAKSAIRAGVEILLQNGGLNFKGIDEFILAGAFGTYLDLRSAIRIGMFPPMPMNCFRQVGNAAGMGAKQMLVSVKKRREAEKIARQIEYLELTTQPAFTPLYLNYLNFETIR